MTPSVKKLLKSRLSEDDSNTILEILKSEEFDLSRGSDSVLAVSLVKISEFDFVKLKELFVKKRKDEVAFSNQILLYNRWVDLGESYAEKETVYYKELATAIIRIAHIAVPLGLVGCSSHGTLCVNRHEEKGFSPVLYVVPLVEGGYFVTVESGANFMEKSRAIKDQMQGKIVSYDCLCQEIESILS